MPLQDDLHGRWNSVYDGAVTHNGAVVSLHGQVIARAGIPAYAASNLLLTLGKNFPNARLAVELEGDLYANFDPCIYWRGIPYFPSDFHVLPDKTAEKLIVGMTPGITPALLEPLLPSNLYVENTEDTLCLIMSKKATKAVGIKAICDRLQIPLSQTLAFGNDYNDIAMLQECGVGVAVSNAVPAVKSAADAVCLTNDEDGVAHWIEENVLCGQ